MENFNLMAEGFDTDKRLDRAKIIANKIKSHIVDGHKKTAMEYGCGTGLVGLQLEDVFNKLLLVDSSAEMINQVKLKLSKHNNPNIKAYCCDLMVNAPELHHVDYIFLSLVMHHIMNTKEFLCRLHSLLNDSGRLLVVDIDSEDGGFHAKYPDFQGHNGYEHSYLTDLAAEAGFRKSAVETFYHDIKMFNGQESPYSLFIFEAVK